MRVYIADQEASERMGLAGRLSRGREHEVRLGTHFMASAEDIVADIRDAEVLCVALGGVTAAVIDAAPSLRLIVKCGIGLDNIDVEAARARGVGVVRTATANSADPAEWVIGSVIAHLRRFSAIDRAVRSGTWDELRVTWAGRVPSLSGRTLGIVGVGAIGRRLASLANAHGMHVIGHDPYVPDGLIAGVTMVDRTHLLRHADVVSLNMVLTDDTRHWLSHEQLAQMKSDSIVVNCSRGPVIDEPALIDALRAGAIGGAVLDVLELEPPVPGHPLLSMDQVLLSPHLSGCTDRGYAEIGAAAAGLVSAFHAGRELARGSVVIHPVPIGF